MEKDMIYGVRPVIEAFKAGKQVDKVMMLQGLGGENIAELKTLATEAGVNIQPVPNGKLNRLTRKNHQGVVAFISPVVFQDIERIIPMLYEEGKVPLVLMLDRITDVRNFGAIVRSAECAGVHAIVIPDKGSARISEETVKTSAGALFNIPVCKSVNLEETTVFLKDSGLEVLACTEKSSDSLYNCVLEGPLAVIMGSEEDGISAGLLKNAHRKVKIPLQGKIGSLNVSVATAVVLFEVLRQRQLG